MSDYWADIGSETWEYAKEKFKSGGNKMSYNEDKPKRHRHRKRKPTTTGHRSYAEHRRRMNAIDSHFKRLEEAFEDW